MSKVRLNFAHQGFAVRRFHTVPTVHNVETVGHHTAEVIAIIFALYDDTPPVALVRQALYHDAAEAITGDVPATAKWDFPKIKEALDEAEVEIEMAAGGSYALDEGEWAVLKFADMFSLVVKATDELRTNNRYFATVYVNGKEYCEKLLANELVNFLPAHDLFNSYMKEIRDEQS